MKAGLADDPAGLLFDHGKETEAHVLPATRPGEEPLPRLLAREYPAADEVYDIGVRPHRGECIEILGRIATQEQALSFDNRNSHGS